LGSVDDLEMWERGRTLTLSVRGPSRGAHAPLAHPLAEKD
jgi:hypothetical protein